RDHYVLWPTNVGIVAITHVGPGGSGVSGPHQYQGNHRRSWGRSPRSCRDHISSIRCGIAAAESAPRLHPAVLSLNTKAWNDSLAERSSAFTPMFEITSPSRSRLALMQMR